MSAIDITAWRNAIRADTFANYHLEMGVAIENSSSLEEAARHYQMAVAQIPGEVEATGRFFRVLRRLGRTNEAQAVLVEAEQHNPAIVPESAVLIAARHVQTGAAAGLDWSEMATAAPWLRDVAHQLIWLEGKEGENPSQPQIPADIDGRFGRKLAEIFLQLAAKALSEHRWQQAEHALETASRLSSSELSDTERMNLGLCRYRQGFISRAIVDFKMVNELPPGQGVLLYHLGLAWLQLGRWSEALDSFGRAALVAPADPLHRYCLGITLVHQGLFSQALQAVAEGMRCDATGGWGYLYRFAARLGLEDLTDIEADLAAAGRLGVSQDWQKYYEAALHLHRRNPAAALQALDEGESVWRGNPPTEAGMFTLLRAGALRAAGDLENASRTYEQTIAAKPEFPWPRIGLVATLLDQGRLTDASDILSKLNEHHQDHPWTWMQHGRFNTLKGDFSGARMAYQRALASGASPGWADFHLGGAWLAEAALTEARQIAGDV